MSTPAIPCDGSSCEGEFSIFIGDIAPAVTEVDLVNVFRNPASGLRPGAPPKKIAPFLSCTSANIIFDTATGQPKGFAFVRFTKKKDMIRALSEMNGILCCSRPMRVSAATSRGATRDRAASVTTLAYGLFSPQESAGTITNPSVPPHGGLDATKATHPPRQGSQLLTPLTDDGWVLGKAKEFVGSNRRRVDEKVLAADPYNTTVFIGNQDPSVTEDDLAEVFGPFGPYHYIKVPPGKRVGFVQYHRKGDAARAIKEMNGSKLGGNVIRVSWGESNAKAAKAAINYEVEAEAQELMGVNTPTLAVSEPLTCTYASTPSSEYANLTPTSTVVATLPPSPGLAHAMRLTHVNVAPTETTFGTYGGWGGLIDRDGAGLGLSLAVGLTAEELRNPPPTPRFRQLSLPPTRGPSPQIDMPLERSQSYPIHDPAIGGNSRFKRFYSQVSPLPGFCSIPFAPWVGCGIIDGAPRAPFNSDASRPFAERFPPGRLTSWTSEARTAFASEAREAFLSRASSTRTSFTSSSSFEELEEPESQAELGVGIHSMVNSLVEDPVTPPSLSMDLADTIAVEEIDLFSPAAWQFLSLGQQLDADPSAVAQILRHDSVAIGSIPLLKVTASALQPPRPIGCGRT